MDHFELLKITEGKNRKKSLVFHIVDHKNEKHYELLIAHVCQNKAYKKLKEFHSGYISQYTAKVTKNKMPWQESGLYTSDLEASDFEISRIIYHVLPRC